ncbi:serine/threonine protein kinase, partial [Streptomyces sp. SID5926]|nr:serine/threonine protein kinase [Streptomyces sp. SID5926]
SDLWSLGVLLCAVLSGASPFHRDSLGGVLHAVVTEEIRPPAQAGPLLPVVRGLLERDPRRRLDAASAQRMLRAFLSTGRTPATPEEAVTVQPLRARRSVKRSALLAVLLVVAAAGAGVSAAALFADGGDDGGGTPTSSVPATPTSTPPSTPPSTPTTADPGAPAASRSGSGNGT